MTGLEALRALREGKNPVRIKRKGWGNEEWIECDTDFRLITTSPQYDNKHGLLCVPEVGLGGLYGYECSPVMMIEQCLTDFLEDDWELVG